MWWWIVLAAWLVVSPVISIVVGMVLRFEQTSYPQGVIDECSVEEASASESTAEAVPDDEPAMAV
jgi:hypothetical protein